MLVLLDVQVKPEIREQAMKMYNEFVSRNSFAVEDNDVSLKGLRVMHSWFVKASQSGKFDVIQLQKEFNKAGNNFKLENQRTRARRGLIDAPGEFEVWQDISVDQANKLLSDEQGPRAQFDAMKLRAAENLEFYWNVPQYQVQELS